MWQIVGLNLNIVQDDLCGRIRIALRDADSQQRHLAFRHGQNGNLPQWRPRMVGHGIMDVLLDPFELQLPGQWLTERGFEQFCRGLAESVFNLRRKGPVEIAPIGTEDAGQ